jgi:hypothetical protein
MNEQPNTGGSPADDVKPGDGTNLDEGTAAPSYEATPEPPPPPIEPADDAIYAPASTVARDTGTFGSPAPAGRRPSGVRWAIALGGIAVVIGVTVAILALASNRSPSSIAVGYMPTDTISYTEVRFDLPGDQRAKLASALSTFPAFADQAALQPKLYDIFDRIVLAISQGKQSYTADIDPWFSGQIAMGSGAFSAADTSLLGSSPFGSSGLIVITIKDQAKATDWIKKLGPAGGSAETPYNGATIYGNVGGGSGSIVVAVTDKVILAGPEASVRAAIDSKGDGKLADDAEFKAALGTVSSDYVVFAYTEYRASLQSAIDVMGAGSGLQQTTVDDELLLLVPTWEAAYLRFENDSLVGQAAFPSIDFGFEAKNKRSTLINHAPASTLFYAESHDIGAALTAMIDKFRDMPDLRQGFSQVEQAAGIFGGFTGILGWWGDVSVVVSKGPDGSIGGGVLIAPTDAIKAKATFDTLRSFVVLAGQGAGIELRDVQHGSTTVTVLDFTQAAGANAGLPPGVKAELAFAVRDDVVVVGYGEAWVNSILDAGPGTSLADNERFKALLKRVGEENIGLSFVDINGIREVVEPLAKEDVDAENWAFYQREILPYVEHLDAFISSAKVDGDIDRLFQALTRK